MPIRNLLGLAALLPATGLLAQQPPTPVLLPERTVTVTRSSDTLQALGASVSVITAPDVARGRLATTVDEALGFVPGVLVGNRWNYSLDQRLSIRGAGARANFGLRGVKILVDGVPQTLPDGQSQLTNLDLSQVSRVEVLRGAASSLEGNAAGGVIAFTTRAMPQRDREIRAGIEHGSFGTTRAQVSGAARIGTAGGTIAVSSFTTDGFREHSRAEQRRASLAIDWTPRPGLSWTLRAAVADDPRAENPGALTAAEAGQRRDAAASGNVLRNADKDVAQQQFAVGVQFSGARHVVKVTAHGLWRALDNPLATPPPSPAAANEGTFVQIDRRAGGVRAEVSATTGTAPRSPRVTVGFDLQQMHDQRENRRSVGGVPSSTLLLQQVERVRELGPFAQVAVPLGDALVVRAGARYDRTRFAVDDAFRADGDASGARTMSATSMHAAMAWTPSARVTLWTSGATSFETPTTTELVNRETADGGFNEDLDPQRSASFEVGARLRTGLIRGEVVAFHVATRDALIGYRESAGRTFFRNAGRTRTRGAEAAVALDLTSDIALRAAWTITDATFTEYRVVSGASTVDLAGNRLAGIPRSVARLGVQGRIAGNLAFDVDHAWSSGMFADDTNLLSVPGWSTGVTGARVAWRGSSVSPFVVVTNAFNRSYTGSVTINGFGGRVFEPSAGRAAYVGLSLDR